MANSVLLLRNFHFRCKYDLSLSTRAAGVCLKSPTAFLYLNFSSLLAPGSFQYCQMVLISPGGSSVQALSILLQLKHYATAIIITPFGYQVQHSVHSKTQKPYLVIGALRRPHETLINTVNKTKSKVFKIHTIKIIY